MPTSPDVLVLGTLGYHQRTIVQPIIDLLRSDGLEVHHAGGSFDFFVNQANQQVVDWSEAAEIALWNDSSIILFVDFWNLALPLYASTLHHGGDHPRLVGLYHGGVDLPGDLVHSRQYAAPIEELLWSLYDEVIVSALWVKMALPIRRLQRHISVGPWPVDSFNGIRPETPHRRKVLFAGRREDDRGWDRFLAFADNVRTQGIGTARGITFHATSGPTASPVGCPPGIEDLGTLSEDALSAWCGRGGYLFASPRQELFGYSVYQQVARGLQPLLDAFLPAYHAFPDHVKFANFEEASAIVDSGCSLSNESWRDVVDLLHQPRKLLAAITGSR